MRKKNIIVVAQATLSLLIGISFIIQPVIQLTHRHTRLNADVTINPSVINGGIVLMVIGIVLIYVSFYLYTRRKVAYIASIILTSIALILTLLMRHKSPIILILETLFIAWMLTTRHFYAIKSDSVRIAFGIRISLVVSIIGFTYGIIGFLLFGPHIFHHQFSFQEATIASFQTLFTFIDLDTPTKQAQLFVYSINVLSVMIFALIIGSLFKPVQFILGSHKHDKDDALAILETESQSSEDYFKIWPDDKYYFFSSSRQSFLAYKIGKRTAIILGDPCGDTKEFSLLISTFYDFVVSNGWAVAAINATAISESTYKQQGLKELFIGNEAIISIDDYLDSTAHSKHFRYVHNRAKRDGLTTEYWPKVDDAKLRTLKNISDAWLSRGGRKEYTFFMGYFDPTYLKSCSVMVLKQQDTVIAYINIIPSFAHKEASIDHLRSLPDTSPAAMHYLLSQIITLLAEQKKDLLNIGFAPLSGIEMRGGKKPTTERLLRIFKKFGNRYYSFQGVEQFKGKFKPTWHPRHLYYSGNVASLARIVQDIEQASRLHSERTRRQKVTAGLVTFLVIAALIQFL